VTGPDPLTPDPGADLDELAAAIAAAPGVDLSDIIAAGEAALDELARTGEAADLAPDADADADADLYAAVMRLAHNHPVYVPPARLPNPSDEAAPIDSLAGAADVLRAYLAGDPAVTPARAHEALALVERIATAGDNLLPPAAVAARLGVSVDTVRRLIAEGQLPAVRLGYRTMRVPVEGLAAYRARLDQQGHTRPEWSEGRAAAGHPEPGNAETAR
jgi:excisionase family DNA binding protein